MKFVALIALVTFTIVSAKASRKSSNSNFDFNLKTRNNDLLTLECDVDTNMACSLTATTVGNIDSIKYKLLLRSRKVRTAKLELQKLVNDKITERYDLLDYAKNDPDDSDELNQIFKSLRKLTPGIHRLVAWIMKKGLSYKKDSLFISSSIPPRLSKVLPKLPPLYVTLIANAVNPYYDDIQSNIPKEIDDYAIEQGGYRYRAATGFDVNLVGKTVEGFPERLRVIMDYDSNLKISVLSAHFSLLDVIDDNNIEDETRIVFRDDFERLFE